jgi:short-subunit dehydrogenase
MTTDEYDFAKDQAMVGVNLLGAMAWLGPAAARFSRAERGHIVGISSVAGDRGRRANPAYNSSKAGLDTYLEALRNRLTQHGVTVTTVKPGFMDTRLLANAAKTMWVISPEKAAVAIARAIRARRQVVYLPGRWRWVMMGIRHTPSFIFRRLNI